MNFRKATTKDITQLAKMRWDFQTENEEVSTVWIKKDFTISCKDFYQKIILSDNWLFWLAIAKGEVIAHVSMCIIDNIPMPTRLVNKWGYLTNTYTKEKFRGQGVGAKLIQYIIDEAQEIGIETAIVWPSEKSTSFYEKAGFCANNEIMEMPIPTPS